MDCCNNAPTIAPIVGPCSVMKRPDKERQKTSFSSVEGGADLSAAHRELVVFRSEGGWRDPRATSNQKNPSGQEGCGPHHVPALMTDLIESRSGFGEMANPCPGGLVRFSFRSWGFFLQTSASHALCVDGRARWLVKSLDLVGQSRLRPVHRHDSRDSSSTGLVFLDAPFQLHNIGHLLWELDRRAVHPLEIPPSRFKTQNLRLERGRKHGWGSTT